MLGNEQEFFLKDIFIIISAIVGLVILVIIQLKNMSFRLRPIGRRETDIERAINLKYKNIEFTYDKGWIYSKKYFEIPAEEYYLIWRISVFTTKQIELKTSLKKLYGHYWYNFSDSQLNTEKIIAPIFRKIVNKYKNRFESEKSIELIIKSQEDNNLYTWLKNESQIRTAIYNFLDECIYIAKELEIKPKLLFTLSDCITLDVIMPRNELLLFFEQEFKELYAVDFSVQSTTVKITLWIAFSQSKVPEICISGYSKSNIMPEIKKAS